MNPRQLNLPLYAALVPLLTFNTCYLIAATLEHVPWCFTYLQGCTSVSSTGRTLPESLVFKAGMFVLVILLALIWHRTTHFLHNAGQPLRQVNVLRTIVALMCVSLLIYAVTVGSQDEAISTLRRIGIVGFALGTFLTQALFVWLYRPLRSASINAVWRWLFALCIVLPLIGIASEVAKSAGMPRRATNNIAAWNSFLLITAYYLGFARIWWHHKLSAGRAASPRE